MSYCKLRGRLLRAVSARIATANIAIVQRSRTVGCGNDHKRKLHSRTSRVYGIYLAMQAFLLVPSPRHAGTKLLHGHDGSQCWP